jgi:hypothetical protein
MKLDKYSATVEAIDASMDEIAASLGAVSSGVTADDYDPTPWCAGCGALKPQHCHCGEIAPND